MFAIVPDAKISTRQFKIREIERDIHFRELFSHKISNHLEVVRRSFRERSEA